MRYIVPNRRAKQIKLQSPGPRGPKCTIALSFPVKGRFVTFPESAAKQFAAHIAELVKVGVLIAEAAPAPELKPVQRKPVKKNDGE